MKPLRHGRPLKRWRYVGVFGRELMLCAGDARIGPVPQRWWAVAQPGRELLERTTIGGGGLAIERSAVRLRHPEVTLDLAIEDGEESGAVETVARSGPNGYVWTRKLAGARARGTALVRGTAHSIDAAAVIDETAGYHERHTAWRWSAGVGTTDQGEAVGWNLVAGVNDDPENSERTMWTSGSPVEVGPVTFADDLSSVAFAEGGALAFRAWAERRRHTNLLLLRSAYRQPFGTFTGELPDGRRLAEGYGVMELHDAHW